MAPKKRTKYENQPKLMEYAGSDSTNHSLLSKKQQLDKEIAKLIKIRREIESRQIEENKIIKKILKLQIGQSPVETKEEFIEQDEEYMILTTQNAFKSQSSPSILKLILGGYGTLHSRMEVTVDKDEDEISKQTQIEVKQWKQNTNLKQQFLSEYSNDFIHYLSEMQYISDDLDKTRKNHRF